MKTTYFHKLSKIVYTKAFISVCAINRTFVVYPNLAYFFSTLLFITFLFLCFPFLAYLVHYDIFRYLKEDKPHGSAGGLYNFKDVIIEEDPVIILSS